MKVTPELLAKITAVIQKHHAAFVVDVFGEAFVPPAVLEELKAAGLLDALGVDPFKLSYLYGQASFKLKDIPDIDSLKMAQLTALLKKNPMPLSVMEQQAVAAAKVKAASYVQGLGNIVQKDTLKILVEADQKQREELRSKIRAETTQNVRTRETVAQLKSDLGHELEDWTRNLDRIAITEKHAAMQEGVADAIRDEHGEDARVAILPMPEACRHCLRLHLGPDGQPRIFLLSQLAQPGANVGRKSADWVASVGPVHPHCQCQLVRVPNGWGFDEAGNLVPGGKLGVAVGSEGLKKSLDREDHFIEEVEGGRINFHGLPLVLEHTGGGLRFWKDHLAGEVGLTVMSWPYGYIDGVIGADGEDLDVYVGPHLNAPNVYVVHQRKKGADGSFYGFDEDKVMLGFASVSQAKEAYCAHYDDPGFFGGMSRYSLPAFLEKVRLSGTNLKKGRLVAAGGSGGGVNLQTKAPPPPVNAHDVTGLRAFLTDASATPENTRIVRDPEVYNLGGAGIDWEWPGLDQRAWEALGVKSDAELEDDIERTLKNLVRIARQDRDAPKNTATVGHTESEGAK